MINAPRPPSLEKGRLPRWSEMDDMTSEAFHRGLEELAQERKGQERQSPKPRGGRER